MQIQEAPPTLYLQPPPVDPMISNQIGNLEVSLSESVKDKLTLNSSKKIVKNIRQERHHVIKPVPVQYETQVVEQVSARPQVDTYVESQSHTYLPPAPPTVNRLIQNEVRYSQKPDLTNTVKQNLAINHVI